VWRRKIHAKSPTHRIRNLLTTDPSTPVINDGHISDGNVVGMGLSGADADVDAGDVSNEIVARASLSSISNDVNRRAISLRKHETSFSLILFQQRHTFYTSRHVRSETRSLSRDFPTESVHVSMLVCFFSRRCGRCPSMCEGCCSAVRDSRVWVENVKEC